MKPREPRQKVVLPARMRSEEGFSDICIRDISSRGMLLQADNPPERGSYVEILRPGCEVTARVIWAKDHRFGIQTRERISLDRLLDRRLKPRPGPSEQPPLDQLAAPAKPVPDPWAQAEASRRWASAFQFGIFATAGAVAALVAGSLVYGPLSQAFGIVSQNLR